MNRLFLMCIAALLIAALQTAGAQQGAAQIEKQLARAHHRATVDGDVPGAIEEYRRIVAAAGTNRSVAALALVRMAECYQKLGDRQARQIYERVLREYADQQQQVTVARARLGTTAPPVRAAGDRAVWTGRDVDLFGRVSPNGKLLTYVDWFNTGNVMVHDLESGVSRALTAKKTWSDPGEGSWSTISRDGRLVAYGWNDSKGNIVVRISPIEATAGIPSPRQVASFTDKEVRFISVLDWSPDGKSIAMTVARTDGTGQIGVLSTVDGSLRVLKSVGWTGPERVFFSGDGKHLAYDLPASDVNDQRDIFVLAVDGSREIPAVVHAAKEELLGWSLDGTQLLFRSDRTGSNGVWAVSFVNGNVKGAPELLKVDVGPIFSLGITNSGTLYAYKSISTRDIKIASVDLATGKLGEHIGDFQTGYLNGPRSPEWSPDGKSLAYSACGGNCLVIRTVDTGEVRQVGRPLLYFREPRWAPDGRSVVVASRDDKGRNGIFQVDVQTGAAIRLIDGPNFGAAPQWSPDGKKLYYSIRGQGFLEWDVATQSSRPVFQHTPLFDEVNVSPDGRFFAARTGNASAPSASLLVVPVDGGEPRELLRLSQPEHFGGLRTIVWARDSRSLLVTKIVESRADLLLVPIDGQPARRLDIDPTMWTQGSMGFLDSGFSLSPDGRRLAFLTGKNAAEIWALENFLPPAAPKK
jgi:Tol biopolymer transport system component